MRALVFDVDDDDDDEVTVVQRGEKKEGGDLSRMRVRSLLSWNHAHARRTPYKRLPLTSSDLWAVPALRRPITLFTIRTAIISRQQSEPAGFSILSARYIRCCERKKEGAKERTEQGGEEEGRKGEREGHRSDDETSTKDTRTTRTQPARSFAVAWPSQGDFCLRSLITGAS